MNFPAITRRALIANHLLCSANSTPPIVVLPPLPPMKDVTVPYKRGETSMPIWTGNLASDPYCMIQIPEEQYETFREKLYSVISTNPAFYFNEPNEARSAYFTFVLTPNVDSLESPLWHIFGKFFKMDNGDVLLYIKRSGDLFEVERVFYHDVLELNGLIGNNTSFINVTNSYTTAIYKKRS